MAAVSPVEVLVKTKQLLRAYGWVQDAWYGPDSEMCLVAALSGACGVTGETANPHQIVPGDNDGAFWMAVAALQEVTGQEDIMAWQDKEGRTLEQVYMAIDAAIVVTEEDGGDSDAGGGG